MKLSNIKANPSNPRVIKDDRFQKLVKSISEFPKMMELRPMVINDDNVVLGGNMRLKALKELKYKEIPDSWVKRAEDLTDEEQRRFIIADNVGFGEHDWETLKAEWDIDELSGWGVDVPEWGVDVPYNEQDYSDKNKEIDTDDFSDKMKMTFEFSSEEYSFVQTQLSYLSASKEESILKVLKYEQSEI